MESSISLRTTGPRCRTCRANLDRPEAGASSPTSTTSKARVDRLTALQALTAAELDALPPAIRWKLSVVSFQLSVVSSFWCRGAPPARGKGFPAERVRDGFTHEQPLQVQTAAELDALLPAILDKAFKGEL
jgi:hypothetical protein